MKSSTNTDKKDSNCRNKNNYPLDEKCCIVLYALNAAVSTSNQTNTYFCSAEGYFESRYNNHTLSFRSHRYKHHNNNINTISAFLDFHLQPLAQAVKSYIKDTTDFLDKLRSLPKLPDNIILCTVDVVGLYPNIPHEEDLSALRKRLDNEWKNISQVIRSAI